MNEPSQDPHNKSKRAKSNPRAFAGETPTKDFAEAIGVTDRRHARRLRAETSDGGIKVATSRERYEAARAKKTEAEAETRAIELAVAKGRYVDAEKSAEGIRQIGETIKAALDFELDQIAVENDGQPAVVQRENNRRCKLRIFSIWQDWAKKHGAN